MTDEQQKWLTDRNIPPESIAAVEIEPRAQYLVVVKEGAVDQHTFKLMSGSFYQLFHAKGIFLRVHGDPREAVGVWEIEEKR